MTLENTFLVVTACRLILQWVFFVIILIKQSSVGVFESETKTSQVGALRICLLMKLKQFPPKIR